MLNKYFFKSYKQVILQNLENMFGLGLLPWTHYCSQVARMAEQLRLTKNHCTCWITLNNGIIDQYYEGCLETSGVLHPREIQSRLPEDVLHET